MVLNKEEEKDYINTWVYACVGLSNKLLLAVTHFSPNIICNKFSSTFYHLASS
jgi:hypothetical protein